MPRVLVLSAMFPTARRPNCAIFVERQTVELAREPGIDVRVVAPVPFLPFSSNRRDGRLRHGTQPPAEHRNGLAVYRPRWTRLPRLRRFDPALQAAALLPFLTALRAEFAFEVICAEWFWPDGPVAMRLARAMSVPFLVKARGDDVLLLAQKAWARRQLLAAARAAGQVLAVSGALRDQMAALGFPARKIAVHHTGVDRSLFRVQDKVEAKARLGIPGPLLLAVGGLTARKNQALLLDALTHISGATLLLAGGGPDRPVLEARARALGLEDRVRFLGSVPQALLPDLYAAADVTVSASLREGLANALVESLACGTPVVTGDVEGAREVVRTPAAGSVVPLDRDHIAAAVRRLLDVPPRPEEACAAVAGFSWAKNAADLAAHLRSVAS
jgi:teichuronic acid biosynthesis glycosyltransferase TuaC